MNNEQKIDKAKQIWNDEYVELMHRLETVYSAFRYITDYGTPNFTYDIPTAAIGFDSIGKAFILMINPELWINSTIEQKAFIIAHEAKHVFFNHGIRSIDLNSKCANIAQDIVINESLAKYFFNKCEIDPNNEYCWYDTVLNNIKHEKDREFEYYYQLLLQNQDKLDFISDEHLLGNHDSLPKIDINSPEIQQFFNENNITAEDLQELAGSMPGNKPIIVNTPIVKKKKKWESVIKKWIKSKISKFETINYHWAGTDRRFATLKNELQLPSTCSKEKLNKEKMNLYFFLDTSGSCVHLANRFFKAAKSIPEDRFNIKVFCFDTSVYETSLKTGKLYGFGGTYFHILEKYVLQCEKYPDAVFVITDGGGSKIVPKYPKRWYWFLSKSNNSSCIHTDCNIYNLKDYE